MNAYKEVMKHWEEKTPEERRAALDALGAIENQNPDEQVAHDVLATLVAVDEKVANDVQTKPEAEVSEKDSSGSETP